MIAAGYLDRMLRALHLALLGAGAALFVALVRTLGLAELIAELRRFGPAFAGVVAFELVLDGCNTLGWRRTLPPARVGFWRLYWVRQAGTAVNQLTPTASLGGEVVKALLLRPHVAADDAVASVVAAKLSFAIAQMLLVLAGLTAILTRLHDAPTLRLGVILASIATCAGVAGFTLVQRRGLLARAVGALTRVGVGAERVRGLQARAARLDARLAALHRERPGAFLASITWHFVAQLVATAQLSYVLRYLGTPAGLATCLAIEAFALVLDSALFFVPGRVGVQEGSRVFVFTALGLRPATGLAVAIVVRLTQLTVAMLGLAAYAYFSLTREPATASPAGTAPIAEGEPMTET